jgi:hypothetical protein
VCHEARGIASHTSRDTSGKGGHRLSVPYDRHLELSSVRESKNQFLAQGKEEPGSPEGADAEAILLGAPDGVVDDLFRSAL